MRLSIFSSEPLRDVPDVPWRQVAVTAIVLCLAGVAGWEMYWRFEWFQPSVRNSDGLWAITRDRIDREPGGVVIVGSSRVLFDINLESWRDRTGILPIQLAMEGTNPRPFLTHVAQDTAFAGLVVVGVTEVLFFPPDPGLRAKTIQRYRTWTPADRASQWLSMHLVESWMASYDPDIALVTILKRQPWWPARPGMAPQLPAVRKLANTRRTRQADMWSKVELHPEYREIARNTWLTFLGAPRPAPPPPEVAKQHMDGLLRQVAADVAAIRARGGEVVFVRAPSSGPFRDVERKAMPREHTWDPLLQAVGALGVHFEDHADLQGFDLPEWSHIRAGQTDQFTRNLIAHMDRGLQARGTPRPEVQR